MTQEIMQAFQLLQTMPQMEMQYNKPATPVKTNQPVINKDSAPAKPGDKTK